MDQLLRGVKALLMEGMTIQEAWEEISRKCQDPSIKAVVDEYLADPVLRPAILQVLGTPEQWAKQGLPVPWI